jgi:Domain of unknown function (DUF397)
MNANWRKSSFSNPNGGNCVEVAGDAQSIMVRDTTNRDGLTLTVTARAWLKFTSTIKL